MEETQQDIVGVIQGLKEIVNLKENHEQQKSDIVKMLDSLVEASNNSIDGNFEFDVDMFSKLLGDDSDIIVAKTAKAIAEISKTESGRNKCTDSDLTRILMTLLKRNDIDILTQTSRALGNICYDNENASKMLQDNGGLSPLLSVLQNAINLPSKEDPKPLLNASAGLLLNYLVNQKSLQQNSLDSSLVPTICKVLETEGSNGGEVSTRVLLILEILNDAGIQFLDEKLTQILVDLLSSDTSPESSQICLELLHDQSSTESSKLLLAKSGICQTLLTLLETHASKCTTDDSRSLLKTACNLIVLIIAGDESMNLLYSNSTGPVYQKLVSWLEASTDEDLQIAAVLSMGNFARTDTHCQLMVQQGIHKLLFHLLSTNNTNSSDIRFQHALLSAVRNLVIPAKNKPIMLEDGLIDVVYPMLEIPALPVVFKLLGTLRIVIDKQQAAAAALGSRQELIRKAIEWCKTEDAPGVQGEANRLIAWLVFNSVDQQVVHLMIDNGALEHLAQMVVAPHAVMQNEALLSLVIMTAMAVNECQPELLKFGIDDILGKFFKSSRESADVQAPIVENAVSFLSGMIKSEGLKEFLKESKLPGVLEDFLTSDVDMPSVKTKMQVVLDCMKA